MVDTLAGGNGNDQGVDFDVTTLGNLMSEIDEGFAFVADSERRRSAHLVSCAEAVGNGMIGEPGLY